MNKLKGILFNINATKRRLNYYNFSSSASCERIQGILPPICTPFAQDQSILWKELHNNLIKWEKIGFNGYVILGSNGEYAFLNEKDKLNLVKAVKESVSNDRIIIAGAGCESTLMTIDLCEKMAKIGADYVLVVTPHYYQSRMNDVAMENYFTKVADSSPVPVILYNMPSNTHIDISAELCINLSYHPNIVGLKDSGGNIPKLATIVQEVKKSQQEFAVLAGSAGFLLDSLQVGCTGGICALANVLGSELLTLYNLFKIKDFSLAKVVSDRLQEPNRHVTRLYGVAALKASLDAFGYYGGPCRQPLLQLNPYELEQVKKSFTNNGFKWNEK